MKANAASSRPLIKDKAVVPLNLQGGASHIETFDPKMTAPAEYRAMFGEVKTKLPGVTTENVFATIMSTLVDLGELRVTSDVPTEINRHLNASKPIPQLT